MHDIVKTINALEIKCDHCSKGDVELRRDSDSFELCSECWPLYHNEEFKNSGKSRKELV